MPNTHPRQERRNLPRDDIDGAALLELEQAHIKEANRRDCRGTR